jgi:hypothetical protein
MGKLLSLYCKTLHIKWVFSFTLMMTRLQAQFKLLISLIKNAKTKL